ncbi:unnamed protein product [Durusdinium trenchii]|uniref:Acyltransferase n=1 Tax=Durusdinium trenchii TaxID=1381693 RepID=A0ABP0RAF7_9DINO
MQELFASKRLKTRCAMGTPAEFHCFQAFTAPDDLYELPLEERRKTIKQLTKATGPEGFPPRSLTAQASMSWSEELFVMAVFFVIMGGPLFMFFGGVAVLLLGTWPMRAAFAVLSAFLALHPLPGRAFNKMLHTSNFTKLLFKYFSYRFVWCDDFSDVAFQTKPWIGAGPPHGVFPLANLLSIPAINDFLGCPFVGAAASVVFVTPWLRYMTLYGVVPVDRKSIEKAMAQGHCVGIVPDGVAGIFKTNGHKELLAMKDRKGIARLALRTGMPIMPAYSFGNTTAFSCWYDSFGILESISRKAQASMFLFWGRFGLPIPRRTQVTMAFGRAIEVSKVENPTEEQIDEVHQKFLQATKQMFDLHKASLGWGDKEMEFV